MNSIFVNSDFRLILDTEIDISTAPTKKVAYLKPGATAEVEVNATLYGPTSIYYDFSPAENNTAGQWLFRARIVDAGGNIYYGEVVAIDIRSEWHPFNR